MLRALAFVEDRPWAMTTEAYDQLREIAAREHEFDPEAMAAKLGRPLKNTYTVSVRDGVGILPVQGALFKRGNLFTEISGATSLEMVMRDFGEMQTNAEVSSIVFDVDSPGGEMKGVNEFAKFVVENRGKKPIIAYVGGMAASGGYWISAAADEIVADETAIFGSLGVVMTAKDTSERDAKSGVKTYEIVSSQSPLKRTDIASDEGQAHVKSLVDKLADEFIGFVATHRNVSKEKVLADFGKGGLLTARDAVAAGMADRLGSLEGVIAALSQRKVRVASFGVHSAANIPSKGEVMEKEVKAAEQNTAQPPIDVAAITATAREEGRQAGLTEGRTTERTRISAILNAAEATGREATARTLATETDLAPEAAVKVLASAAKNEPPKATASSEFAAHMAKVANPQVGVDTGAATDMSDIDAEVDKILKAGN
jgi:capsid assembly protease